jgi:ABC-2 type transport system ATP-binding protein
VTGEQLVECRGVSKRYRAQYALHDLDLDVFRGEVFGLLGPNGAGKTTLIRILLGLAAPTAGRIQLFGEDLFERRPESQRRIGAIVEAPAFFEYMSGWENLYHLVALSGGAPKARLWQVLDLVGLREAAGKKVGAYSLGMKQRLGIAQALLPDADFLILDEPANGLDPHGIAGIRELIRALARDHGKTVFLSSHLLAEVEQVCDRIVIVHRGRKVLEGRVADLCRGARELLVRVRARADARELFARLGAAGCQSRDGTVTATFHAGEDAAPELVRHLAATGLDVLEVRLCLRTLEEIFLQHTRNLGDTDVRVDAIRAEEARGAEEEPDGTG